MYTATVTIDVTDGCKDGTSHVRVQSLFSRCNEDKKQRIEKSLVGLLAPPYSVVASHLLSIASLHACQLTFSCCFLSNPLMHACQLTFSCCRLSIPSLHAN